MGQNKKRITKKEIIKLICEKNDQLNIKSLSRMNMTNLACIYDLTVTAPKQTSEK